MARDWNLTPIGSVESCFEEKFGVPRQSLMTSAARGVIRLEREFSHPDAFLHLSGFSHLWVVYVFHKAQNPNHPKKWSNTIIPPRLEAPPRVGVFASRSPHRPNPIGLSVVRLDRICWNEAGQAELRVSGLDILDGSPVLDVKPYVAYADSVPEARSGWVEGEIPRYAVRFLEEPLQKARELNLQELIEETLAWDPRPRSQRERHPAGDPASEGKRFAFRLKQADIHFEIRQDSSSGVVFFVVAVLPDGL